VARWGRRSLFAVELPWNLGAGEGGEGFGDLGMLDFVVVDE
jgi:hypothetical protein